MNKRFGFKVLPILLVLLLLCACGAQPAAPVSSGTQYGTEQPKSVSAWLNSDIDGAVTEETTARLQDDFNLAVNKDYILNLEIPAGKTQNGGFYEVAGMVESQRIEAMKDETQTGHDADLVHKYYAMLSDWETRNQNGAEPVMKYVKEIQGISSLAEMTAFFANKERGGYYAFVFPNLMGGSSGCLFSYDVGVRDDDPTTRIPRINPLGLSLGDSAEYKNETENGKLKREENTACWMVLLSHLGFNEQDAKRMIDNTFKLETLLAENMLSVEAKNDPANVSKLWNPTDFQGVCEAAGTFPIGEILKGWGFTEDQTFNVVEPDYMKSLAGVYTEENLEMIKDAMIVKVMDNWCFYLDKSTRDEVIEAGNKVNGIVGMDSDDSMAMKTTLLHLPLPLDNVYIRKFCKPEVRDEITAIIQDILKGYHTMLEQTTWLTEETRKKAIEKLDAITIHAVYPEELESWEELEFQNTEEGGNLVEATITIDRYFQQHLLGLLNQKVDRTAWNRYELPVSEANAFYMRGENSITILAGILNGVVYQSDFSYEQKLGCIGVIIGHEISHAFDPGGAQYDKDGVLNSWWTEEDKKAFDERAKKLIQYYDSLEPVDGIQYSGNLVQTEAVADLGGMKAALMVAAEKENFDYDKFFMTYAKLWAVRRLKSEEINRTKMDVHPLAYLRTNVTVAQFDEFQKQYDIKEGDGMYFAPEDRITVW